jgi:hypothetical protein
MEAEDAAASPGPWLTPQERGSPYADEEHCPVDHEGCDTWPWRRAEDMVFAYAARTDRPALVKMVRSMAKILDGIYLTDARATLQPDGRLVAKTMRTEHGRDVVERLWSEARRKASERKP